MIIRLNGMLLSPAPEESKNVLEKGWDELTQFADWLIQSEADLFVKPAGQSIYSWLVHLNHDFVQILPELTVFIAMVLITIGMYHNFGRWLARALLVFLGGVTWISLSSGV